MLGTEPGFSARATSALNFGATSQALGTYYLHTRLRVSSLMKMAGGSSASDTLWGAGREGLGKERLSWGGMEWRTLSLLRRINATRRRAGETEVGGAVSEQRNRSKSERE